jgi:phosphoribosyl 1,2-cyclic phosphodiesterase/CRP-like cAMP-binding protein
VATSRGPMQFGIPPETIKDCLALGIEVPQVYVVPRDRFDTVAGLNMCEIEFPGYYQFFIRGRSLTLVSSAEAEKSLKHLMHEILQGPPEAHLYANEECLANYEARPDHMKEMAYFVRPRNGRSITVDSLFHFIQFEPNGVSHIEGFFPESPQNGHEVADFETIVAKARINDNVEIYETQKEWIVYDKGHEIARVEFWLASTVPPRFPLAMVLPTKTFVPPTLGVTVLGSSHGFDAKQSTSGFVLWMHGKGIMVDPPPNATDLLKRGGISPRWISAIILTHCHADHDAGTFQKILVEGRVTLMTTKTIMASFLRKYSKISGFTEAFLCRLFEPRVVKIGEDVFYGGGILRFHYAFHALPCIGFQCHVAGKSIAYSADTLYEPRMLDELYEEGVLSQGRKDALLAFPFETSDLVIHEAGIPPIHTPVEVLKTLSENALKRLYVIHIAEAAAESSGLRLARAGTEHTIRVADGDAYAYSLDVLTNSELFFPYLASVNKFGRGIVSAAQERMAFMDYEHPQPQDFCFLDCTNTTGLKRFYTSSAPSGQHRERGSSFIPRPSNLIERPPSGTRDSDLSYSSVRRNSTGFEAMHSSPTRPGISTGRRTSASTNKSLAFSSEVDEEDFTVPQVADLLRLSKPGYFKANQIISAEEGQGDSGLFLIMKGFCRVERTRSTHDSICDEEVIQPAEGPPGTILEPGDCFGLLIVNANRENRLIRKCVIKSLTDVDVLELSIDSLWYLLNVYPALDRRLSRMHELRALEAWRTMELNSCLRRLASFQRTQLNAVLELKEYKEGEELWTKKSGPRNAFLVAEGQLVFTELADEMGDRPFEAGAFLCDFHSMVLNRRVASSSSMSSSAQQQGGAMPSSVLGAHAAGTTLNMPPSSDLGSTETSHNSSAQSLTSAEQENHLHFPSITLLAKTDCRLYQINWRDALQFLESNPGVLVQIYHSYVVE